MSIQYTIDASGRTLRAHKIVTYTDTISHRRARISHIIPAGYHAVRAGNRYLLHRCHIIADQLTLNGAADPRNIITGTFSLNIVCMLPVENAIRRYVQATHRPVVYSVTLRYAGACKIPFALHLQAWDQSDRQRFGIDNILHNIEPGYTIDYSTGDIIAIDETQ